ncbi:hypothetical protein PENSPDRAFT_665792 [Peniophora sp. CONT]|nr:hypothetical protein PENSPDRAFT_665792 [Peniophora sp. CONT]
MSSSSLSNNSAQTPAPAPAPSRAEARAEAVAASRVFPFPPVPVGDNDSEYGSIHSSERSSDVYIYKGISRLNGNRDANINMNDIPEEGAAQGTNVGGGGHEGNTAQGEANTEEQAGTGSAPSDASNGVPEEQYSERPSSAGPNESSSKFAHAELDETAAFRILKHHLEDATAGQQAMTSTLTGVERSVNDLSQHIQGVATQVTTVATGVEQLDGHVQAVVTSIGALQAEVQTVSVNVVQMRAELGNAINTVSGDVRELDRKIQDNVKQGVLSALIEYGNIKNGGLFGA